MIIGIIAVIWVALVIALLVGWSRLHANARAADGIDEALYINAEDLASFVEAA